MVVCVRFFYVEFIIKLRANFEKFTKRTENEPRENQNKVHYKNAKHAPKDKFGKNRADNCRCLLCHSNCVVEYGLLHYRLVPVFILKPLQDPAMPS